MYAGFETKTAHYVAVAKNHTKNLLFGEVKQQWQKLELTI